MNICVFGSASEDIGEQYKKDTEEICKALQNAEMIWCLAAAVPV